MQEKTKQMYTNVSKCILNHTQANVSKGKENAITYKQIQANASKCKSSVCSECKQMYTQAKLSELLENLNKINVHASNTSEFNQT